MLCDHLLYIFMLALTVMSNTSLGISKTHKRKCLKTFQVLLTTSESLPGNKMFFAGRWCKNPFKDKLLHKSNF